MWTTVRKGIRRRNTSSKNKYQAVVGSGSNRLYKSFRTIKEAVIWRTEMSRFV